MGMPRVGTIDAGAESLSVAVSMVNWSRPWRTEPSARVRADTRLLRLVDELLNDADRTFLQQSQVMEDLTDRPSVLQYEETGIRIQRRMGEAVTGPRRGARPPLTDARTGHDQPNSFFGGAWSGPTRPVWMSATK